MKYIFAVTIGLLSSPVVFAQCDTNKLNADQLVECITVEGAGENYDHWKSEYAKIGTGQSREEKKDTMTVSVQEQMGIETSH